MTLLLPLLVLLFSSLSPERILKEAALRGYYLDALPSIVSASERVERHEHVLVRSSDETYAVLDSVRGEVVSSRFGLDWETALSAMPPPEPDP